MGQVLSEGREARREDRSCLGVLLQQTDKCLRCLDTIRRFTGHDNGCVYGAPGKFVNGRTPGMWFMAA